MLKVWFLKGHKEFSHCYSISCISAFWISCTTDDQQMELFVCLIVWILIIVKLQFWMKMTVECVPSYFQGFLKLLSHSTCLRGVPFTTGSQVSQLGHELLHLLTFTHQLLPVRAWQCIGQPAALCHQPTDGCLAWIHTDKYMKAHKKTKFC